MYAKKLTKAYLMESGLTEVTTDGHVFKRGVEIFPTINAQGYFMFTFYDKDENGNKIPVPKKNVKGYTYKSRSIGLHRLMWAWHYGEVQDGMVIDHINNKHYSLEDYHLSNLNCITPKDNVNKDKKCTRTNVYMTKYTSEEDILRKIRGYELAYEDAKARHDAKAAHNFRCALSTWRAKHKLYLENPEKYTKTVKQPVAHECHARAEKRRELQARVDNARKYYQEALEAYGKDDEYVLKLKGEWKIAIAMLACFKAENKRARA